MSVNVRRNLAVQLTAGGANPLKLRLKGRLPFTMGTAASAALIGQGGTPAYAYSITAGALPTTATFNASITTTVMTVNSISNGAVVIGQPIFGSGVTAGQKVVSFGTGTGGTGTYNLSISNTLTSRAMTATLALAAATGIITGTPSVAGAYTFTAQVQDSLSTVFNASFEMPVSHILLPAAVTPPVGTAGKTYAGYTLQVSGATGTVTWALVSGSLAPSLTLSGAGVISGSVQGLAGGDYNCVVSASDSGTGDSINIPILTHVNPDLGPSALPALVLTVGVNYAYLYTTGRQFISYYGGYSLTVNGLNWGGTEPLTFSSSNISTVAPWATLNTKTGVISGTPTTVNNTPQNISVTVTDALNNQATYTQTISTIAPNNQLQPKLSGASVGAAGAYNLNFTGGGVGVTNDGTTMTVTIPTGAGAGTFYSVDAYGAAGDGVTDDSTSIQNAINAAAATGGVVTFKAKTYLVNSQLTFPNDAATPPNQRPVKLSGAGAHFSGEGHAIYGGTVLDMRSSSAQGKIATYGLGYLEIANLTLTDNGTNSNAFVYTTNTTLCIHDCGFIGNPTKSALTCDQDAIILGGTSTVLDGTTNAAFQGYGTVIDSNYFNRIRRAVYMRVYANANVFSNNCIWNSCGTNLASGAAIEIDGGAGGFATGNKITNNLIEITSYPYAIRITKGQQNTLIGNDTFDGSATTVNSVRIDSASSFNQVIGAQNPTGKNYFVDLNANPANGYISANQGEYSQFLAANFSDPSYITKIQWLTITPTAGGRGPTIQPTISLAGGTAMLSVLRSAAEVTNPGATAFEVDYNSNMTFGFGDGTTGAIFTNYGRTWTGALGAGAGGNMKQDSGSGGSFLTLQNYGVKFNDHTGALYMQIGAGLAGFKLGPALDVNMQRLAANLLGTNSQFQANNYGSLEIDKGTVTTAVTFDFTAGDRQVCTLTTLQSLAIAFTSPINPCTVYVKIHAPATGTSSAFTWPVNVVGPVPTTVTLAKTSMFQFEYDGNKYFYMGACQNV